MKFSFLIAGFTAALLAIGAFPALGDGKAKVLFFGDSHTDGVFGDTLDELMREHYDVASYGVRGSTPQWYLDGTQTPWAGWGRTPRGAENRDNRPNTPLVSDLLKKWRPSAVVIELGTNLVWLYGEDTNPNVVSKTDTRVQEQVQKLLQTVKQPGRACIWIGPPQLGPHSPGKPDSQWRKDVALLDNVRAIEKKVVTENGCTFVDSFSVTGYPELGGDGIHYDRAGPAGIKTAKTWARYVSGKIDEVLKPGAKSTIWKLRPPKTDPDNPSYVLDQARLEDRCVWTKPPHFILDNASNTFNIRTSCSGGRAHCRISGTDSEGRKTIGSFYLDFRCRSHDVTTHGYSPMTDLADKMDWLPNFKEECESTTSFKAVDLLQAGCEPAGAITPETGASQRSTDQSGQGE